MQKPTRWKIWTLLLVMLAAGSSLADQRETWSIAVKDYPGIETGKVSVLEGWTDEQGVRSVLNGLSVEQPVQVSLIAADPKRPLKLEVMKGTWENSLMEGTTDETGLLKFRFRVSEQAAFQITSPAETQYQMVVWVGPEMPVEPPPVTTSRKDFEAQAKAVAQGTPPEIQGSAEKIPAAATNAGTDPLVRGLLVGILAMLVAITILLLRGRARTATAIIAPSLVLMSLTPQPALAQSNKFTPREVTGLERQLAGTDKVLQELTKIAKDSGSKELRVLIAGASVLFGYIDPRDAAVAPNYAPEGMPPLPVRALDDPETEASPEFEQAISDLEKWRKLFETLYVIHKTTVLKTGRLIEMGEAAADLSPYAKMAWAAGKHSSVNGWSKAEKNYQKTYDDAYNKLLAKLNESLLTIADYEREHYGDVDWYARYGMPFYLFMQNRYKRS